VIPKSGYRFSDKITPKTDCATGVARWHDFVKNYFVPDNERRGLPTIPPFCDPPAIRLADQLRAQSPFAASLKAAALLERALAMAGSQDAV
jgi:hypothetical protein